MQKERVRKPRVTTQKNTRTEVIDGDNRTRTAKEAEALKHELDELLDDIDEALQGIHENTALNFKQKGGQ